MNDQEVVTNFIRARHIDSFQKLLLLLLLFQDPELSGTSQQFAEKLYFSDIKLLEEIMTDLKKTGVIVFVGNRCMLHDGPDVRKPLQSMTRVFEDPVARQKLLDQVADTAFHNYRHYHGQNKHLQ